MEEAERRRFESVFAVYEIAWRQFNERRDAEFKMSVTLWSALVLAIAGSHSVPELPAIPYIRWLVVILGSTIIALHALWCWGLGRAQNADRAVARCYEEFLKSLSQTDFDQETKDLLKRTRIQFKHWSYTFQLGVTIVLTAALVGSSLPKTVGRSAEEVRQLEVKKLELEVTQLSVQIEQIRESSAIKRDSALKASSAKRTNNRTTPK